MNLGGNQKEINFDSIVIGSLVVPECAGKITFYGGNKIFHFDFGNDESNKFEVRLHLRDIRKIQKHINGESLCLEYTLTPQAIQKVASVLGTKGYTFQISKNYDERKFQVFFTDSVSAEDIHYMNHFFSEVGKFENVEERMLILPEEVEEIIPQKQSPICTNRIESLPLYKNQKKKVDDKSPDYLPAKRPRKQSFSKFIPINDPVEQQAAAEVPIKRSLRNRNRDEINLCEDLSEEQQLQEALKRSLKGIDPKVIDSMDIDESLTEKDPVDLFANVDKTLELFKYATTHSELIVRMEDYICLSRNEYLSDVIIDFYLHFIYNIKMTQEQRDKTFIFGTHFYTLYSISSEYSGWNDEENAGLNAKEKRYKRVQGLNGDVNIFDKDFLIMPLMDHNHWFLAIICFPKLNGSYTIDGNEKVDSDDVKRIPKKIQPPIKSSIILIFDSIKGNGARRQVAINHIKNFLECEWTNKYQNKFPFDIKTVQGHSPKVPLQLNNVDCGCFMLEFFERFFVTSPIHDYRLPIDLSEWFSSAEVRSQKRREIAIVVQSMMENDDIELPCLRYFGDSHKNKKNNVIIIEDDNGNGNDIDENANGNNNDENFNNNNDFYCLDSNTVQNGAHPELMEVEQVNNDPQVIEDEQQVKNEPQLTDDDDETNNNSEVIKVEQQVNNDPQLTEDEDEVIENEKQVTNEIQIYPIHLDPEVEDIKTQESLELEGELYDKEVVENNIEIEKINQGEKTESMEDIFDKLKAEEVDINNKQHEMEVEQNEPAEQTSIKEDVVDDNCDMNESDKNELKGDESNNITEDNSEVSIVLSD